MVLKFAHLKDLDDVGPFNISGIYRVKQSEQVKGGVDMTEIIAYKNPFVVNGKPVTVYLNLG